MFGSIKQKIGSSFKLLREDLARKASIACAKMSTFDLHRLDWLMVSKRLPWNAKYETVYRWFVYFVVIYTIMRLKS